MIKIAVASFILGLSFGWGPCLASCGPLFLCYAAGTRKNITQGIIAYILFSLARILVYLVLGLLVFFLGRFIFARFVNWFRIMLFGSGIFVILLGALMILGKRLDLINCANLGSYFLERDKKSIIILGIICGFLPCAPLLTIISYAGLVSGNVLVNIFYIFSFGLGTSISPLLILAGLAGLIPAITKDSSIRIAGINKTISIARLFNTICGLIIIILGIQLTGRSF